MARKTATYWEKRSTALMLHHEKNTLGTINKLVNAYNRAMENIDKEIKIIYRNYAKDGVLSKSVLDKLLNAQQSKIYHDNLLKTINLMEDSDIKKKLLTKYNAPAYASRISHFEELRTNIDIELKKMANIENFITQEHYKNVIEEGYYRSIYEVQKYSGIGFDFSKIDNRTVNAILAEKWVDSSNFSERIWKNNEKLNKYLSDNLLGDYLSGKNVNKMSSELAETMNVGLYNATTLIRTETAHFANESEMLAYEELGVEKYRFIATLDNVTCKHCAELDNKVFSLKDRQPGKNYPPIHPNDRCTTVAEFDDDVTEELQRRARDESGNSTLVQQDMGYQEWHNKYVEGADYVVKTQSNYKATNEKLAIKQAIKTIPIVKDLLKDVKFDIITQGTSGVRGNTIYILKGADKYEVIHEIGHVLMDKLRINNDSRFIDIIYDTLNNFTINDIIYDPLTFAKGIFRIESDKFVTEYQGRIYQDEGFTFSNGRLNYKAFKDYFPEGLKIYYQDKELLKRKNLKLYNYIEEFINNEKNI